jgi:hypothetical protein
MTHTKVYPALLLGKVPAFALKRYAWARALQEHINVCHRKIDATTITEEDIDRYLESAAKPGLSL